MIHGLWQNGVYYIVTGLTYVQGWSTLNVKLTLSDHSFISSFYYTITIRDSFLTYIFRLFPLTLKPLSISLQCIKFTPQVPSKQLIHCNFWISPLFCTRKVLVGSPVSSIVLYYVYSVCDFSCYVYTQIIYWRQNDGSLVKGEDRWYGTIRRPSREGDEVRDPKSLSTGVGISCPDPFTVRIG